MDADGGGIAYVWIGATDKQNEGTWIWDGNDDSTGANFWNGQGAAGAGTGSAVAALYNNWGRDGGGTGAIGEPDNFFNMQHCGGMALTTWPHGIAGQWNDINMGN